MEARIFLLFTFVLLFCISSNERLFLCLRFIFNCKSGGISCRNDRLQTPVAINLVIRKAHLNQFLHCIGSSRKVENLNCLENNNGGDAGNVMCRACGCIKFSLNKNWHLNHFHAKVTLCRNFNLRSHPFSKWGTVKT